MELEKAAGYTDIRLTNIKRRWSETPLEEPEEFYSLWARPEQAAASFSAICLFFAETIQVILASVFWLRQELKKR